MNNEPRCKSEINFMMCYNYYRIKLSVGAILCYSLHFFIQPSDNNSIDDSDVPSLADRCCCVECHAKAGKGAWILQLLWPTSVSQ